MTEHEPMKPVDFYVLLALLDRARHGYGIVQDIDERSAGRINLVPGNLYPMLRRMVEAGWLEEDITPPDGGSGHKQRRYYGLTAMGRHVAAAEARRLRSLVDERDVQGLLEA